MKYIDKLLQGEKVEWKTLGEVAELSNIGVDKKINPNEEKVRLLNFVDVFRNRYIDNNTPTMIVSASDRKIKECNILKDEFTHLKAFQTIEKDDEQTVENFKETYFLTDEDIKVMEKLDVLSERLIQDYRSTYNDIRDWFRREREGKAPENPQIDWGDVVFEIDLLKSQEINLDYILELIFERNKKLKNKNDLIEEVSRTIRASIGNRAKEGLVVDFIQKTNWDMIENKADIIAKFFTYAQEKQKEEAAELIKGENLNIEAAKRYIKNSLKREYASENGTELSEILPKMSPLNPNYLAKKQSVFEKIVAFVEKFKGVGGEL